MNLKFLFTVLLAITCESKLQINVNIAPIVRSKDDIEVKCTGEDDKVITDKEIELFNVTKENLFRGIRVELGRFPRDVYLKDPTRVNAKLFAEFEWPEVQRKIRVKEVRVAPPENKNVVVNVHQVSNHGDEPLKSKTHGTVPVTNIIQSDWSGNGLPDDESIRYDVKINFDKTERVVTKNWRDAAYEGVDVPFGVDIEGYINMEPGQVIYHNLTGTETYLFIEIDYMASLIGNVVADYERLYGKYHFYAPTVDNIMRAAGLPNEIVTTETMMIRCYTNAKVDIYDKVEHTHVNVIAPVKLFKGKKRKFKNGFATNSNI